MIAFLVRRTLLAGLTLVALSIVTFSIFQLYPGGILVWGDELWAVDEESIQRWDLEPPALHYQYYKWVSKLVRADFGRSRTYDQPIEGTLADRMLLTVVLAGTTVLFTWTMAIPIGIYTAVRQRSPEDYTLTFVGFIGLAIPDFMLALVVMYFSLVYLGFSPGGLFSPQYASAPWSVGRVLDFLQHLWVPVVILGTSGTAALIRIMRANLLDELRRPYVVTARAKGLSELRLVLKYPVRVALNPLISTVGYILPVLISGSIIVSQVMSLPTVGPVLLQSLLTRDVILASTIIMLVGMMTVAGTLLSDILLVFTDPRIRLESK
jgi:peptide/nickel transport system permease protein